MHSEPNTRPCFREFPLHAPRYSETSAGPSRETLAPQTKSVLVRRDEHRLALLHKSQERAHRQTESGFKNLSNSNWALPLADPC